MSPKTQIGNAARRTARLLHDLHKTPPGRDILAPRPAFGYDSGALFLNLTEEPKMAGMRSGLVIVAALLLSGSAALAQQAGKPCAGDTKTLCAGIQPGEGRIKACIKSHLTELSPTCTDRVLTVGVTGKACKADVAAQCAGVVPGTGGLRACIKEHMAALSDACKDAMSQAAAGKKLLGGGDL
jgi:hypothetical protein